MHIIFSSPYFLINFAACLSCLYYPCSALLTMRMAPVVFQHGVFCRTQIWCLRLKFCVSSKQYVWIMFSKICSLCSFPFFHCLPELSPHVMGCKLDIWILCNWFLLNVIFISFSSSFYRNHLSKSKLVVVIWNINFTFGL